jgi:hypothetical protein
MKLQYLIPMALLSVAALAFAAGGHPHETASASASTSTAKAAPAATLGDKKTARWTATTVEAATGDLNKKVLASGKQATVTGEVVDVSCYLQLGKRGEAHVACGSKCIANGEPIGLVDDKDNLYILFAEEHHPRRDGQVSLKESVGSLLAKTITLTGMATESKGYRALFVQAAELDSLAKSGLGGFDRVGKGGR